MSNVAGTESGTFATGETTKVISLRAHKVPLTLVISYASLSTQKVELSAGGGTEYFEPPYASSTATQKVVTVGAPISHVKFTGVAGNTWRINSGDR